jgi:hypothetical protein
LVTLQRASPAFLARAFQDQRSGQHIKVVPRSAPKPPPPRVVSGLGDEALWNGQWLQARIGGWLLTVTVKDGNAPDLTRSIALARLGVQRLPR